MKKITTALIALPALLLGSVAAGATEASVMTSGSAVEYRYQESVPSTLGLYNTSTTGYEYEQEFWTRRENVAKVCPKNDNYWLFWYGPTGNYGEKPNGECVILTVPGTFQFGVALG